MPFSPSRRSRGRSGSRGRARRRGRPRGTCRCGRSGRTSAASCASPSSAATSRRGARSRGPSRSSPGGRSPGATPTRPGNCTEVASASVSGATSVGASSSRANASRSSSEPVDARPRAAVEARGEPERLEHGRAQVVGERHLRVPGERLAEDVEARSRSRSAARPAGDRRSLPQRQAGRVSEQVAEGRAGRAGRLVEVDRPLLGGDEAGERGHRLRHRRPAELAAGVAVHGRDRPRRCRPRRVGRPALDGPQSVHSLDTREMERRTSPPARPTSRSWGSRVRCASGSTSSSRARRR